MLSHLRNDDIVGGRVWPSPTAGSGRAVLDRYTGQIVDYRCKQCGFVCNPTNGIVSPGTANQGDGFQVNDSVTGDPTGGRPGCPFCATGNSKG